MRTKVTGQFRFRERYVHTISLPITNVHLTLALTFTMIDFGYNGPWL